MTRLVTAFALLASASVALNGFGPRVTLLRMAAGDVVGRASIDRSADADRRWGHASVVPISSREEQLRARGVGEKHSYAERSRAAEADGDAAAAAAAAAAGWAAALPEDEVAILPLSEVAALTEHLLLLKVDTEGHEAGVLAGTWALWDAGRTVENVVCEVKQWNTKAKRDLLRHLARSAGLSHVYTYREVYKQPPGGAKRGRLSLEGRLEDVSAIILNGAYDTLLPHEDFWLRREPVPASFLLPPA